jgi:cytochrome c5
MLECSNQENAPNILEEEERIIMRTKTVLLTIVLLVTLGLLLAACGSKAKSTATQPAAAQPPAGNPTVAPSTAGGGEALLNERCTKCHSLGRVTSAKKTAADWENTVTRMVGKGASLTSEEQKVLVEYLAKTYAP